MKKHDRATLEENDCDSEPGELQNKTCIFRYGNLSEPHSKTKLSSTSYGCIFSYGAKLESSYACGLVIFSPSIIFFLCNFSRIRFYRIFRTVIFALIISDLRMVRRSNHRDLFRIEVRRMMEEVAQKVSLLLYFSINRYCCRFV